MEYRKVAPTPLLKSFVECYFIWQGEVSESLDVQSPPNGFNAMVFNYAAPYEAYQNNGSRVPVPKAFVSGMFTSNYHLVLSGKIGMIGVVFRPSSLHNFFGLRMSHLVNSRMPLGLLLQDEAEFLWSSIKAKATDEDRIHILEQFLLTRLPQAKARLSVVDEGVELIDFYKGSMSVEDVACQLKISRRYMEKKFLEKVGVSPKFYARIRRFVSLSKQVAYNKDFDWQDIVFKYGLHDQSHLVKEFMEFNQMNPSDYRMNHNELVRFVKR